mmetsp:Transcript_37761/g.95532  ORF Transcript_37761/g.95532 Transcript_37761/m.95532 type:complete len:214 (+) Transcript_37761:576-1217(+)
MPTYPPAPPLQLLRTQICQYPTAPPRSRSQLQARVRVRLRLAARLWARSRAPLPATRCPPGPWSSRSAGATRPRCRARRGRQTAVRTTCWAVRWAPRRAALPMQQQLQPQPLLAPSHPHQLQQLLLAGHCLGVSSAAVAGCRVWCARCALRSRPLCCPSCPRTRTPACLRAARGAGSTRAAHAWRAPLVPPSRLAATRRSVRRSWLSSSRRAA